MVKKIIIIFLVGLIILLITFFFILGGGFGNKQISTDSTLNNSLILFAHRGIVGFPENSRESINAARSYGLTAVEIDIRQTKDDVFVLFHDVNCKRLLGETTDLSELNYRQLKQFPIICNEEKTNSYVLSLEEFLNQFSDLIVYLDTKTDGEKTKFEKADKLVEKLKRHNALKSVIIANADFVFLSYIEYNYPEVLTALEGFSKDKIWIYKLIPKNFKTDYLSSSYKDLTDEEIDWLKKNNLLSRRIIYHVDSFNVDTFIQKGITKIVRDFGKLIRFD